MVNVFAKLSVLVMTCSLGGCLPSLTTHTGGISSDTAKQVAEQAVETLVRDTCAEAWLPTTYSSRDTPETQLGNRANNASRDAWCARTN